MKQNTNKHFSIIEKLKDIYSTMVGQNVTEIELKDKSGRLKIKRFYKNNVTEISVDKKVEIKEEISEEDKNFEVITSPINGVFYRAPSPSSPPFVKEGDIVNSGDTLCIIEAMKIMNEIKSDKKCQIIKILCENNTSVSVGTKLFLIKPI